VRVRAGVGVGVAGVAIRSAAAEADAELGVRAGDGARTSWKNGGAGMALIRDDGCWRLCALRISRIGMIALTDALTVIKSDLRPWQGPKGIGGAQVRALPL
jgi:hypothetical protein